MKLADLLFPPHCPYCGTLLHSSDIPGCPDCTSLFPQKPSRKSFYGNVCISPFHYDGIFRKAILRFKFYNRPQYAKQLAMQLAEAVKKEYAAVAFDFVTCVPLSKKGKKKRGYNQSALLAGKAAKQMHLPYKDTLIKNRENESQHSLPKNRRADNVKGAYLLRPKTALAGKTILLIDDIVTTGNTLRECCFVLKSAGAKAVYCATAANVE